MTDKEYLERIKNYCISNKNSRILTTTKLELHDDGDADIQFRAKMYYPIELSSPMDSLDVLLGNYDEEQKKIDNRFQIIRTGDDADDNALTKDERSIFASRPLRKMIFAPPGCSKTLFTQKLALYLADIYLDDTQGPILFPLYLHCDRLNKSEDNDEDFVRLAHKMQVIKIDEQSFKKIIKEHTDNGILIIDGLDECSEDARKLVAKSLNTFLNEHNDVGFVITSRLRPYSEQELAYSGNTDFYYIKKLDDSAVFGFIRKWRRTFRSIKGESGETDETEVKRITEIINSLNEKCDENIRSLVRIPMHLSTVLTMIEKNGKELPGSIEQYYDGYIGLKKLGVTDVYHLYDKVIKYTAYWMSCNPHKRYVSIDKDTLTDKVIGPYIALKRAKERKPVEEVLDTLVNKMSVLMPVSLDHSDEYRFEHLSLQELLTAKALISEDNTTDFDGYIRKDRNPVDFIRRITYDGGWKEYEQIIRYVLQLSSTRNKEDKEEIEYLLKKRRIYDTVNSLT